MSLLIVECCCGASLKFESGSEKNMAEFYGKWLEIHKSHYPLQDRQQG